MNRIPIVFTPDDEYVIPTCVAICSMLDSKQEDTQYYFYIIVGRNFNSVNFEYIERIKTLYQDFRYEVIIINNEQFDDLKINTKHLTTSAFYRLFMASLIPKEEKVMYHDGDILVLDDLTAFFECETSGKYVCGVPSIYAVQHGKWREERVTKWGFEHTDDYIFSGDMIVNLALIRDDRVETLFAEHMTYGYPSEDQDVINKCCIGKIGKLPLRFCMLTRWIGNNELEKFSQIPYSKEEIDEAQRCPAVVHFAGADAKPWVNVRVKYGDYWWEILKKLLSEEEYEEWYTRAKKDTEERDWGYYEHVLNRNVIAEKEKSYKRDIVIYGFGKAGKELYQAMMNNRYKVSAIVDANALYINAEDVGSPILTPIDAVKQYNDALVFVTVQGDYDEICLFLKGIGYQEAKFIYYASKGDFYYQVIADNYWEFEEKDMQRKKGQY